MLLLLVVIIGQVERMSSGCAQARATDRRRAANLKLIFFSFWIVDCSVTESEKVS